MKSHLLSILVAFAGYSLLDTGKASQKLALGLIGRRRVAGASFWLAATLSTLVSSFLLLYAVSIGSVVIVGAMAGTGLAAATLFSIFVLKERPNGREILGVVAVLIGPFVIGSFSQEPAPTSVLVVHLYLFMVVTVALFMLTILLVTMKPALMGVVLSGLAGSLGGFVVLFQKISTSEFAASHSFLDKLRPDSPLRLAAEGSVAYRLVQVFANPYALTWSLLSLVSMFLLQLSYKYDRAIRIIPSFAASSILIPIVGGVLVFREQLHPMNWVGVAVILIGVGLILFRGGDGHDRARATAGG